MIPSKINSKKGFTPSLRGFTLIELLIVIAILAVLATAVVAVLNPAQLLKQARDSTRISDLSALNSAIALYLSDVSSPNLGTISACPSGIARCTASSTSGLVTRIACTVSTSTSVTSTGWVDINFASSSAGSPLPKEPIDPVNSTSYFYSYGCNNTTLTYEIDARMESTKYGNGGGSDVVSTDGGDAATTYEVGNSLTL